MPKISISAWVPADPAHVFGHVTAHPAAGDPDLRLLEEKYGRLEDREGYVYTFQDRTPAGNRWLYTFDPPNSRVVQALDSDWSDRIDTFETSGEGTTWSVTWEPRNKGAPFLLRWLFFRWKDRQELYEQMMAPVVEQLRRQGYY